MKTAEIEMMTNAKHQLVYVVKFFDSENVVDSKVYSSYTHAEFAYMEWTGEKCSEV